MTGTRIFKANLAYTKNPKRFELVENGYVVTENGLVEGIYPVLPGKYTGAPLDDLGGGILIPAFTDLHLHAPQLPNIGVGYDLELMEWLERHTFPLESRFADPAFAEAVYTRLVRALWEHGALHSVIMATRHMRPTEMLLDMLIRSGLCAYAGKVNMDRNAPAGLVETTEDSIRETEALLERYGKAGSRVRYIVSPRFVPSTTPELMAALGRLAARYEAPVQSHLSESIGEIELVRRLHPEAGDYASVYEAYGLLGRTKTVMAHCIYCGEEELESLRHNGVFIAHCPQSNLNVLAGIMPLRRYLDMGLRVGLGSDIGGGNTLNMFEHIALAVRLSKIYALQRPGCAQVLLPEAFYLATKGGGAFFGKTGSFEPGYSFDALELDDGGMEPEERPLGERVEKLIYCGGSTNIRRRILAAETLPAPL